MSKGKAKAKVEEAPKPKMKNGGGKTEYLSDISMRYANARVERQKAVTQANKSQNTVNF